MATIITPAYYSRAIIHIGCVLLLIGVERTILQKKAIQLDKEKTQDPTLILLGFDTSTRD